MLAGLCPDWETWDPKKPVDNAREAMQQADDWLGVPQVRRRGLPAGGTAGGFGLATSLTRRLRKAGEVAWTLPKVAVYLGEIA